MDDDFFRKETQKIHERDKLARRILGVGEAATTEEIKKAFWLLAMEHHPDKNPFDKERARNFQNIVNAYEFLVKRRGEGKDLKEDGAAPKQEKDNEGPDLENEWGYYCWWRNHFDQ